MKPILCLIYFLTILWVTCWVSRDVEITEVWWGFPFVITSAVLEVAGVLLIIKDNL